PSGVIPCLAHFSPTANVGHGNDDATVHHRNNIRIEEDIQGHPVGAVSVKIKRALAVEFDALQVHHGDGNLYAVGGDGFNTLYLIAVAIVAAGDFLALEQRGRTAFHVVFEDRLRRNERLIGVPELGGAILAIDVGIRSVRRFGKFNAPRLSVVKVGDSYLRQSVLALVEDVVVLEKVRVIDHDIGSLRYDFLPVLAAWIGHGSFDQTEVAAGVVHPDVERVSVVVGIIFNILLARLHDLPLRGGLIGGEIADLRSGATAGKQQDVSLASRLAGLNIEALVLFFIDKNVVPAAPESVPIEAVLAFRGVFDGVEQCSIIVCPGHRTDLLSVISQDLSRAQIFDRERVLPKTSVAGGVSEQIS